MLSFPASPHFRTSSVISSFPSPPLLVLPTPTVIYQLLWFTSFIYPGLSGTVGLYAHRTYSMASQSPASPFLSLCGSHSSFPSVLPTPLLSFSCCSKNSYSAPLQFSNSNFNVKTHSSLLIMEDTVKSLLSRLPSCICSSCVDRSSLKLSVEINTKITVALLIMCIL